MSKTKYKTATIASSATTSDAIDLESGTLCGIYWPSAFTGASVTFEVSYDNNTYYTLVDTVGNALAVTKSLNDYSVLDPNDLAGVSYIKLVSASTEGAEREVVLAIKDFS